jgi:hypothetical protein
MDPEAAELFKAAFGDLGEPVPTVDVEDLKGCGFLLKSPGVARRQPGFVPMLARRSTCPKWKTDFPVGGRWACNYPDCHCLCGHVPPDGCKSCRFVRT